MSEADWIQEYFSIDIKPIFDFVPIHGQIVEIKDTEVVQSLEKVKPSLIEQRDPHLFVIKFEWRMVLNHPTFSSEYRNYIRE